MLSDRTFSKIDWERKAVDVLWGTAVIATFAFGTVVASMFTIGLAAEQNLLSLPKQHCHYLAGNQQIDKSCG